MLRYFEQEGYVIGEEDHQSLTAFKCLMTNFNKMIEELIVLIGIHDIILHWSKNVARIKEEFL